MDRKFYTITLLIIFVLGATVISSPTHAQSKQSTGIVMLTGYKVIPKVPTPASGTVIVTLKNDTLFFDGSFENLSNRYTKTFIHYGKKSENGNKLFELSPELNENKTAGSFNPDKNFVVPNQIQLEALGNGLLYIAIYSSDYNRGEIRGQIPKLNAQN